MKYKVLCSFIAYNIIGQAGETVEIADKGQALDLEKLGWIEPIIEKAPKKKPE